MGKFCQLSKKRLGNRICTSTASLRVQKVSFWGFVAPFVSLAHWARFSSSSSMITQLITITAAHLPSKFRCHAVCEPKSSSIFLARQTLNLVALFVSEVNCTLLHRNTYVAFWYDHAVCYRTEYVQQLFLNFYNIAFS